MKRLFLILVAFCLAASAMAVNTWAEVPSVIFHHLPDTIRHEFRVWAVCGEDTIYSFYVPRTQLHVGDTLEVYQTDIQTNPCATWRTFLYYDKQEVTSSTEQMTWKGVVTQPGEHKLGWGVIVYHTTGKVSDKFISYESIHVLE